MTATLVSGSVQTRVNAGDKFRATWNVTLPQIVNAATQARAMYNDGLLTSLGFVPVSSPSAKNGDKVVVFDLRTSSTMAGKTIGDVMQILDGPTFPLRYAVRLAKLEPLSLTLTAEQLAAGQAGAVVQGNKEAPTLGGPPTEGGLFDEFMAWLKGLLGNAAKGVGIVVGVVIVAGVAYYYVSKRRS